MEVFKYSRRMEVDSEPCRLFGMDLKIKCFIMKIMIWILWMPIIFRLWYIYECLLGSWYTSVGFTFGVFSLLTFMAQWTFVFSGLEMGALAWGVGHGRGWWWRHHNHVNGIVLVSLFFALEMFRATFCCFRFWLWACRRLWAIAYCKYIFLHFL